MSFLPSQGRQGIYRRCDRGSSPSFCEGALRGSRAKESAEKDAVRAEAERLQAQSRKLGEESEAKLRPHEQLALALTFVQIAIVLAVITVVTRRRWLLWGSGGAALVGVGAALVGVGAAISAMLMR